MTWKIRKSGYTVIVACGHSLRVVPTHASDFVWEVRPLGSARTKIKNKGPAATEAEAKAAAVARLREIVADGLAKLDAV